MIRNVRRTHWDKHTEEVALRLIEPTQMTRISSIEDIEELASVVHSQTTHYYETDCLLRNTRRMNENLWWNSKLASLP